MDELKQQVGREAAQLIESGMVVGLGTGSTVRFLLEAIAARIAEGSLRDIVGVPTSEDTRRKGAVLGIPLGELSDHPSIDLALDGADEVDPSLDLIKGLGGALLREKIVVTASSRFVVLADESKRVPKLGTKAPLPVEVDPFSLGIQLPFLAALGSRPVVRMTGSTPFRTDGGHLIVDCYFENGIDDSRALAEALDSRPGIIEHGMFIGVADEVLLAGAAGMERLRRQVDAVAVVGAQTVSERADQ